ncbi:hypothetical protein GQF61_05835 [Sphingobacterium sp. DK4209]|uniref:Uncharacterized protein n=1 Tax=Sphingobacterium zhuxiongii TaxID=2662364 RepID=A0A5Q0QFV7_9SPHI|nr:MULTISPECIES: hypothetical protein [unclassified Sphingobacterium]MVZ65368.1 hypothetical protein [Sphingobacterium sp. DK4209]QGA26452.1 hypothetical protein GFH32_08975 [Sphingobacterium sp. dk4302]
MKIYLMFYVLNACIILSLSSCKSEETGYSGEDLQGVWAIEMDKENILRKVSRTDHRLYSKRYFYDQTSNAIRGFRFYGDSCDYKGGFFDNTNIDNGLPLPLGSNTVYRIVGDTLKIWDLGESEWKKTLINRLTHDTLVLRAVGDDRLFKYRKIKKNSQTIENFDEIILATISPDYLSDEFYYLDKQGAYIYQKFDLRGLDTLRYPMYRYRLKSSQLETIRRNFDYVDLDSLKEEYISFHSGDRTYFFLFFIKNGKITKVIKDDSGVSPDELQWGYVPLMYLRRQVNMDYITDIKDCTACIKLKGQAPEIMKELKLRLDWDWEEIKNIKIK